MVSHSITHHASSLITNAQYKAATAADTISKMPIDANEVGSSEYRSSHLINPLLSLKQAVFENSAGVKLLQAEKEMIGSLLDVMA